MNVLTRLEDAPPLEESFGVLKQQGRLDVASDDPLVVINPSHRVIIDPQYSRIGLKHAATVLRLRQSVKLRLEFAATLVPHGVTLIVLDAWRSACLQQEVFDYFNAKLPASVDREKYVFDPSKVGSSRRYPSNAPPHRTGGALDVVLGNDVGRALPMGVSHDEMTPLACTAAFEKDDHGFSTAEARLIRSNRRALVYIMSCAGFSNYPEEYWHYDFGNSFWRFYSSIPGGGVYGVAE
jgi:D-alanyl-D-alanine dipeptidase